MDPSALLSGVIIAVTNLSVAAGVWLASSNRKVRAQNRRYKVALDECETSLFQHRRVIREFDPDLLPPLPGSVTLDDASE